MGEGVKIFTRHEIEMFIAASREVMQLKLEDSPEFMAKYMESFDLRAEIEKIINLLENVRYWMEKAGKYGG